MISDYDIVLRIYQYYKQELLKRRRLEQVNKILLRDLKKRHLAYNLVKLLRKNNLENNIQNYIEAQFFSLDYMKYLPTIVHLCSKNGIERFNKVKGFFKQKRSFNNIEKNKKRRVRLANKLFIEEVKSLNELDENEEKDKRLDYNTIVGFNNCTIMTNLYNNKSNLCLNCKFKSNCKKLLKDQNLDLYLYREGKITQKTFIKKMKDRLFNV